MAKGTLRIFLKKYAKFALGIIVSADLAAASGNGSIILGWDMNPEPGVVGYTLHYGETSGSYDHVINVGRMTRANLTGLDPGRTYFAAVAAYDSSNLASPLSEEISFNPSEEGSPAPFVSDFQLVTNGGEPEVRFFMTLYVGVSAEVFASNNMETWDSLGVHPIDSSGLMALPDPEAATELHRFYRVVIGSPP